MNSCYTAEELELLERRAAALAATQGGLEPGELFERVVVVTAGEERFGIPMRHLKELLRAPRVVKLPIAQSWLVGIVQVRGDIVLTLDPTKLLEIAPLRSKEPFLALLAEPASDLGVLFDEVIDVRDVYRDELSTELIAGEAGAARPFLGSTTDLVAILDMERLLASSELVVDDAAQVWGSGRHAPESEPKHE